MNIKNIRLVIGISCLKNNIKFITRITMIHLATYMLCGMLFSTIFNYQSMFMLENAKDFMHPFNSINVFTIIFAQILRGILFGIFLLLFKNETEGRFDWIKVWFIIVLVGIINTPAPAPFSIEGFVYTKLPLIFHLKGAPEILVQTFLFSYFTLNPIYFKKSNFIKQNKTPIITSIVSLILFSIAGIIIAEILGIDISDRSISYGEIIVIFIIGYGIFISTKWFLNSKKKYKNIILSIVYYTLLAIFPTLYNYAINSPFKSLLSLAINGLIVIFLLILTIYKKRSDKDV